MNILSEITRGILAVTPQYAEAYRPLVLKAMKGEALPVSAKSGFASAEEKNAYVRSIKQSSVINLGDPRLDYYPIEPEDAPSNSVAILDLRQPITKYDIECGPSGMLQKADYLMRAAQNPNIKGILLMQDSGGGEGRAARFMANKVKEAAGIKPVVAFVDDLSASASYYIGAAASLTVANDSEASVGSIGTYMTIADYTEAFAKQGITLHEIYADDSTDKNSEVKSLIEKGDDSGIKALVNRFNSTFLADVEAFRGERLKAPRSAWGTGKIFFADEALQLGLIDEIASLEATLDFILNQ